MIINRLLVKEITKTLIAINVVLVVIAISSKLVSIMGHIAGGDYASGVLLKLIALQIPELFVFVLPLSLFLAIILSLGKAFVDNELPVMFACGFSWARVTLLSLGIGIVVMLIAGYLNLNILPGLFVKKMRLLGENSPTLILESVQPSRFYTVRNGKQVFYIEGMGKNAKQLEGIFIAEVPNSTTAQDKTWSVMTAKRGSFDLNLETEQATITLEHGHRYDGKPGNQDYTIIEFEKYKRLLEPDAFGSREKKPRHRHEVPTSELYFSTNKAHQAELQWRLAIPVSAIILAILGVALCKVPPRGGRFSKVFPAIIIYIVYYNLLAIAKRGIMTGWVPASIGLWVIHLVMLVIGFFLLALVSGRFHQFVRIKRHKGETIT